MGKLSLASVLGLSGLGLLVLGASLFQFYALQGYETGDHVTALGAGCMAVGGVVWMVCRVRD